MARIFFILSLTIMFACNSDSETGKKTESNSSNNTEVKTKRDQPMPEGLRNRRGYPIGTVEQAEQLLEGAKAKRREIARRMGDMISDPRNAEIIQNASKPMEKLRPKLDEYDMITEKIVAGEAVDFLSKGDMGKLKYRQQTLLDALIDSLSYINSLFDQVLIETDTLLIKQK